VKENLVTKEYLDLKFDEKFEEFARMIAGEFKEVHQDIYNLEVKMNDRFDQVDKRFEKMEAHVGRMEIRFGHLDDIVLKDHTPRIRRIEGELGI
jgi:hypothetical protein